MGLGLGMKVDSIMKQVQETTNNKAGEIEMRHGKHKYTIR